MNNRVSVIIPTFNRPDFLGILLKSIVEQTTPVDEVIIVNDASSNLQEYSKLINKYKKKLNIQYYVNSKSFGAPYSRNLGASYAKNELLCFVDDDDYWLNDKIKNQLTALKDENDMLYSWTKVIDSEGQGLANYNSVTQGVPVKEILKECFIPSPSIMVRKEIFDRTGGFNVKFESCQDWELWTRMIINGANVGVVRSYDVMYVKHNSGSIGLSSNAVKGYARYYKSYMWYALKKGHISFVATALKFFLKRPSLILKV